MNLVRLGHLHTPTGPDDAGYCQTALVCGINEDGTVNLAVWTHGGAYLSIPATDIPVGAAAPSDRTFHLSGDCPWQR